MSTCIVLLEKRNVTIIKNGTTSGSKISSIYRRAVKLPSTTMSWLLWRHEIPPHTITLPPPQRDTCLTQQSTPYYTPHIKHFNTKTGLVREQYSTPTLLCPSDTLSTPIKVTDSTFRRQNVPPIRLMARNTAFLETPPYS